MTTKTSIDDLLNIPQRFESLGGQAYAYIRLEEATYLFETILNERDSLAAELAEVKAELDALLLDKTELISQREKAYSRNKELQARLDGGVRVVAKRHPDGWIGWMENSPLFTSEDVYNATLIPDEGVTL